MPCECKGPGFCNRHQRPKTFTEWQKCQSDADHRHELDKEVKPPEVAPGGVGSEIHFVLEGFGFKPGPNCRCHELRVEWDKKGIQWCIDNKKVLVREIRKEASARGALNAAIAKFGGAKFVVDKGISNAKKKGYE